MEEKTTDNRNTFAIKTFLKDYLDLRKDKDNELETVDSIRKGVEFKGANLWILIFAIFMASLGLNVNSTAVIIGAMLISPLMGPIMGVGLSVGLNDFELMKRSLKSFLITTLFSVTTATIFFLVSPVAEIIVLSGGGRCGSSRTSENSPFVELITPFYHFNLITVDPDDNKFVDCAISANAHYIVTNDHHYDVLKDIDFPKVNVVNIQQFCIYLSQEK